ncbi:MAG: hypothetical protein CR961_00235 [Polaribacter sp.]|nr:MAG: hypothetical protein CR961_00235 [Polaribacter sp.]
MIKNKLKALGTVLISTIIMIISFISFVIIANYFKQNISKLAGNIIFLVFPIATYFGVKFFNNKVNNLNPENYGFEFKKIIKNSFLGISLALFTITTAIILINIFLDVEINFSGLKDNFHKPLLSLVLTLIIVGVWEEFYFRGLVFNHLLKNNFNFHSSALISSILFSVVHWSSFDMTETSWLWYIGIVVIGYILVYIYTYTKSIWSVVSFHFLWNFMATLLDDKENKIGLIEIVNYKQNAIMIDNIMVICLSSILLAILIFNTKKHHSNKIKSYINNIKNY